MRVELRVLAGGVALAATVAVLGLVTTTSAGANTPTAAPTSTATTRPAHATVTASSVRPGQTAHVNGTGFRPGETVDATLHPSPVSLGRFTANSGGDVNFSFTVPAEEKSSSDRVVLVGETSHNRLTISFDILVLESPGIGPAGPSSSSVLSDTGADSGDLLTLALATLAGGLLLLGLGLTRREHLRLLRRGKH